MQEALKVIFSGFCKVASVIDSNPEYDYILGGRVNKKEYTDILNSNGSINKEDALKHLDLGLKNRQVSVKKAPLSLQNNEILCYGSTQNNRREFEFFEKLISKEGFDFYLVNIDDMEVVRRKVNSSELKRYVRKAYEMFLQNRQEISRSMLHQTYSYALSVIVIYEELKKTDIKRIVLANDHSPVPVAYAKVAKILGIQTLYLQHAEITESFPALDFDFSILRNKVSKRVYGKKSFSGKVVYANRQLKKISISALKQDFENIKGNRVNDVVLYPSSIFNADECNLVLSELKSNEYISSISVKFHPAFKNIDCLDDNEVRVLDSFPNDKHVAICGNSSVAIELASAGNLVFNYFELDRISRDYYGFSSKGITKELLEGELRERFWKVFNIDLALNGLSDYLPAIDNLSNKLEAYNLKALLNDFLEDGNLERQKIIWFERDLFVFGDAFIKVLKKKETFPYDDLWMLNNLNRLFDERNPELNTIYNYACLDECESVVDFWINSKVIEWNGKTPNIFQIKVLVDFIGKNIDKRALKWIEQKCFDVILRFGDVETLKYFMSSAHTFDIYKTGVNKKISLINFLNKENFDLCGFYDVEKDVGLTSLDKLKVYVQSGVDILGVEKIDNFKKVEENFLSCHKVIREEYLSLVKSTYEVIGERACFIDVKRNLHEEEGLLNLISDKLRRKEGYSFIRLSDGEGVIFRKFGDFFTEEDSLNRQRHWWGEEISTDVMNELVEKLISSVKNADLLGIPSVYRFVRDHSQKTKSLTQSIQGRGLISVLNGVIHIDDKNKLYTDDKANIAVFNKKNVISKLASISQHVVIVNSGTFDEVSKAFGDCFDFTHIQVPTHYKTSLNDKYYKGSKPLPYVYKDVIDDIKNNVAPGSLVLVGAGVAGKTFVQAAKEKGGVGLDLGSAMDQYLSGGIHSLF